MEYRAVVALLKREANPKNVAGMARFGISTKNTLGISMSYLRRLAKQIGRDHDLAIKLWRSGIHEARILASLIEEITLVTKEQANEWVAGFDSWDVCDQICLNLFDKLDFKYELVAEWAAREEEYIRRAAFALMAAIAWHDKTAPDSNFKEWWGLIEKYSTDDRNFVRKAVNWALRHLGKRNLKLARRAIKLAEKLKQSDNKTARWVGSDAYRELTTKWAKQL